MKNFFTLKVGLFVGTIILPLIYLNCGGEQMDVANLIATSNCAAMSQLFNRATGPGSGGPATPTPTTSPSPGSSPTNSPTPAPNPCVTINPLPGTGGTTTKPVVIQNMAFSPTPQTVSVGTLVKWTNMDGLLHSSTADAGGWNGDVGPGQSFSFQFNAPGTYSYHCRFHSNMTATIIVQ